MSEPIQAFLASVDADRALWRSLEARTVAVRVGDDWYNLFTRLWLRYVPPDEGPAQQIYARLPALRCERHVLPIEALDGVMRAIASGSRTVDDIAVRYVNEAFNGPARPLDRWYEGMYREPDGANKWFTPFPGRVLHAYGESVANYWSRMHEDRQRLDQQVTAMKPRAFRHVQDLIKTVLGEPTQTLDGNSAGVEVLAPYPVRMDRGTIRWVDSVVHGQLIAVSDSALASVEITAFAADAVADAPPLAIERTSWNLSGPKEWRSAFRVKAGDAAAITTTLYCGATTVGFEDAIRHSDRPSKPTSTGQAWGPWIALDRKAHFTSAMSFIWRVHRADDGGRVPFALKELRYRKAPGSTAYQRFAREIRTLMTLASHDGIVEVVDQSIPPAGEDGYPYYVMPLAETSLERAAKALRGQLEPVLLIGVKIANALVAAHALNVIHRDVKPSNVLLYGDEREPRLADFGIAYLVEEDRLTRAEAHTVGTDDFVAPELRGGGENPNVTPAADVYSLGKTLYATVAGGDVLPREWLDDARFDLVQKLGDPRLAHLTGLLRRMVTERPEDRYQSMVECRDQLQRAVTNLQEGIGFQDGMYGGPASPVERLVRFSKQLDGLTGHRRRDAIQDVIGEVTAAVAVAAERIATDRSALSGPVGEPRPKGKRLAAENADDLLSVGLPLVRDNELEGLREWLARLTEAVRTSEEAGQIGARWIVPPAATLAVHGVGALAWHRQRLDALRMIVDALLTDPGRWLHHNILGERANALLPWVVEALSASRVTGRAEPGLLPALDATVDIVAGIVLLRTLIAVPADELTAWYVNESDQKGIPTEAYPGYYYPNVRWTAQLPKHFASRPTVEQECAVTLFDLTAAELREECRRITPALARSIARIARMQNRSVRWGSVGVGAGWAAWCGGDPPDR